MPTYQYKCKNCDFGFEDTFKIADRNIPIENPQRYGHCADEESNTHCEFQIVPQFPSQISMRDGWRRHTSDGWKDRLKEIKRQNPGSNIDT
jgi:hypothetical protein|tara:strand:+ start:220 stop:492 length:273 start_codon:yes stop_codon:yes gene_type:complete